MITRHHPFPLVWGYFAFVMISGIICMGKGMDGHAPILLFVFGLAGLLIMQSAKVSDEAVAVSWAFGLRKRVIPLTKITNVICSLSSYTKYVCIYVSDGKTCKVNLGTFKRHARLERDIRSRLNHLITGPSPNRVRGGRHGGGEPER